MEELGKSQHCEDKPQIMFVLGFKNALRNITKYIFGLNSTRDSQVVTYNNIYGIADLH